MEVMSYVAISNGGDSFMSIMLMIQCYTIAGYRMLYSALRKSIVAMPRGPRYPEEACSGLTGMYLCS
jgi:hypothetical protein